MAILGYDTLGSIPNVSGGTLGRMYVSKFTLATPGTLKELHGWFLIQAAGQRVRVVAYAGDGASGSPGTRLAYTGDLAIPGGSGTVHVSEAGFSVALVAADYWIGWICGSNPGTDMAACGEEPGGIHRGITGGAAYNPPPTPFPAQDTNGTRKHSCWAVVTTAPPPELTQTPPEMAQATKLTLRYHPGHQTLLDARNVNRRATGYVDPSADPIGYRNWLIAYEQDATDEITK